MAYLGRYRVAAKTAFLVTLGVVLLLTLSPEWLWQMLGVAITLGHNKLDHAVAFAVLAATGYFAWPDHRRKLTFLLVLTGAVIEVVQGLQMIGRDRDAWDWAADCFGMAVGLKIGDWISNFTVAMRYEKRRSL